MCFCRVLPKSFGTRMEAILLPPPATITWRKSSGRRSIKGKVVLCDRFMDSSRVYQGVTGNLQPDFIEALQRVAVNGVVPDCTLILDLPARAGLERARRRGVAGDVSPDRFEKEELDTHEKRREAFLDIAAREPQRCRVVDALQTGGGHCRGDSRDRRHRRWRPAEAALKVAEAAHE